MQYSLCHDYFNLREDSPCDHEERAQVIGSVLGLNGMDKTAKWLVME